MASKRKTWVGRVHLGAGRYHWVGRFPTKRERDDAVARARIQKPWERDAAMSWAEYADDVLARMRSGALKTKSRRPFKESSIDVARFALERFKCDYGNRPLSGPNAIGRYEAVRWAEQAPEGVVAVVVTLANRALDEELLDGMSPFRGLGTRTASRADVPPPTEEEMLFLLDACTVLGDYAPAMRALLTFAAYTGMRPGECFALEWSDIDFDRNRVHVRRRVYKGKTDLPKSNAAREIALTPPARDALLTLRPLDGGLVFRSKTGRRLSQPTLTGYWSQVRARAGLDHEFYLATKHFAVHYMYVKLGLSDRAIAKQMGWSVAATQKLLAVYGHGDIGALEEIDAAFAAKVTPLRALS